MLTTPPHHQLVTTEDGSVTLYSERFSEGLHSSTGARSETLLHYIEGCEIQSKSKTRDSLMILEVGFGLGMGLLTTMEALAEATSPWHFVSMEIDSDLLEWFREENKSHPFLRGLQWKTEKGLKLLSGSFGISAITILCGDARVTLPQFLENNTLSFDAIYQDAFSPNKNPTLWTREWFSLLKNYSSPEVILSTYSSGPAIRKSLLEAGWSLEKGPGFGKKRSSTRANLKGFSNPDIIEQLTQSPIPALRDDNIEDYLQNGL